MTPEALLQKETTRHVIGAFYEVYNALGYGFLERVYVDALEIELGERGRKVQREVMIPIHYKKKRISSQRVDMMVDDIVLVEVKSTSALPLEHERQLQNYLRASPLTVGFLLHFGPKARFYRRVHSNKPDLAFANPR